MEVSDIRVKIAARILAADLLTLLRVGDLLDGKQFRTSLDGKNVLASMTGSARERQVLPNQFLISDVARLLQISYSSASRRVRKAFREGRLKRVSCGIYESAQDSRLSSVARTVPHNSNEGGGQFSGG